MSSYRRIRSFLQQNQKFPTTDSVNISELI